MSENSRGRIGVVIPCYNDGATIDDTLASAQAQDADEIVIVNDGSTDEGTLSRLAELDGKDGVRVVHQENSGLSAARMAGVRSISTEYVFALDSDDVLEPGVLPRLAAALDASPRAVAAWGDEQTFGRVSVFRRAMPALDPWRITYLNEIPGALLRRSELLESGGWELNKEGYEDWDLWMNLAERGHEGVYVPGVMLRYRLHGRRMLADATDVHERLYDELKRRHERLFAERAANRRRSTAGLRFKLLFPLIQRLPVGEYTRYRLYAFASDTRRLLAAKVRALRR